MSKYLYDYITGLMSVLELCCLVFIKKSVLTLFKLTRAVQIREYAQVNNNTNNNINDSLLTFSWLRMQILCMLPCYLE